MPNTSWPQTLKIKSYLNLSPYIMMPLDFDVHGCLAEALSLFDQFMPRRSEDHISIEYGWKSLSILGLNGDSKMTLEPSNYKIKEREVGLTEMAARCPKTVTFLETITDLRLCGRIRMTILEPGGRTPVHRDNADGSLTMGISIVLNNPVGCDYFIDVDENGRHTKQTKTIPFEAGFIALFDMGRFQYLENNSDQRRVQIIIDGPTSIASEKIESLAQLQNKLTQHNQLALAFEFIRKTFEVLVLDEQLDDEKLNSEMLKMTAASLYPLSFTVCRKNLLDYTIKSGRAKNTKAVVLICAGAFIEKISEFVFEIHRTLTEMRSTNAFVAGDIINRPEQNLLFLHQQMIILDLENFDSRQLGHFGFPKNTSMVVPDFEFCPENLHDGATIQSIQVTETKQTREISLGWGTLVLAQSFSLGRPIVIFSKSMRKALLYSDPQSPNSSELDQNRIAVRPKILNAAARGLLFNSEKLGILQVENFKPEYLYTVASGFKPARIIQQYWPEGQPKKIFVVDYSQAALDYVKQLSRCRSIVEAITVFRNTSKRESEAAFMSVAEIRIKLNEIIRHHFNNSEQLFLNSLKKLSIAEFLPLDLVLNFEILLPRFDRRGKFIFCHLNGWSDDILNLSDSKSEGETRFHKFVVSLAQKYKMKAWKHVQYNEAIIGISLTEMTGLITDGLQQRLDLQRMKLIFDPQSIVQTSVNPKELNSSNLHL